jgi:hypothetical protein
MTRHVRSWAIAALAAFALTGACTPSFAEIIYNVTNYADGQDGWSVAGTITVSGIGTFTDDASAITAWDVTATKGDVNHRWSDSTSTASFPRFLHGTLNATSTTLSLAANSEFGLNEDPTNTASFTWTNSYDLGDYFLSVYTAGWVDVGTLWSAFDPAFSPIVDGAWILGTATPSAVPEIDPATGGSALSLVAGVLAMIEQRRRRRRLKAA